MTNFGYALGVMQQEPVTRETFWRISPVGEVMFYFLAAVTVVWFLWGVYDRFARYSDGTADHAARLDDLPARIGRAAKVVLTNEKQFNRDFVGGVMHAFILWGFLTLLIGTTILAIDMDIWTKALGQPSFFVGDFYRSYSLVMDAMGLLFVVGVGVAIYRRYGLRMERLWDKHNSWEDAFLVWSLFLLGVGGYVVEGLRILGNDYPPHETVSFVGWFVALVFETGGVDQSMAGAVYPFAWWSHALLAFGFIVAVPYAKPFHMISSFANVVTNDDKAGKRLPGIPMDLDHTNAEDIDDFSWKEILDQDACTKCGRCSSVCPAKASGRPLDPRNVILDLKSYREDLDAGETESKPIVADGGGVIEAETMESCMACMACMDACPVDIEHLSSFTKMNRQLTDEGELAPSIQDMFQNVMQKGNTFGDPNRKRADWTEDLDFEVTDAREEPVDYLWYVGDYPSFDDRNKAVARSLATIFEASDVSVGILYDDEVYDGNDVRRVGEEFLFLEQAGTLVESFEACEFDTLVCTDPHSYNTFKNEYPEIDFEEFADDPMMEFDVEGFWNRRDEVEVLHYTQVVQDLVQSGSLPLDGTELDYTVTYHDPCHLGRYNDEYEAPRNLVRATGCDLHEMPRNRANSFCCGGGGGGLWMDFEEEPKPSEERLREALEDTEAGTAIEKFVVACPMCLTMYEDGRKTGGFEGDIEIVGLSELLAEAIESKGISVGSSGTSESATPADD
ncbi:heterodisulfide reductase-related iron-sulfur binding cluster [Halomarina rubra]|uniref:Heterodisulfide reductase-related iron-sulfur binding cluster n=1 Tax=Halomarina rubra TaxID=2071873 RepID=A0ABD6AVP8_9EURY|nr:heterodisulfide reductase-related iron-sulfur binding cluster [Halomarina rubra]